MTRRPKITRPQPRKLNLQQIDCRLAKLDAVGWYKELTKLYKLSVTRGLGWDKKLPSIHRVSNGEKTDIIQVPWPTVQLVVSRFEPFLIPQDRLPVLIVGLDAPDKVIMESVTRQLMKARERYPARIVKRGRPAPNACFDETTFAQWRRAKIVPLAYLLTWRHGLPAEDRIYWREKRLGEEIEIYHPPDVSEAKKKLKEALASLPALFAQITSQPELLPHI
jgi:hypothetical protein